MTYVDKSSLTTYHANPEAVEKLLELCTDWYENATDENFYKAIKLSVQEKLLTLDGYRDYFGLPPVAVMYWMAERSPPPVLSQEEIVEFLYNRVPHLPDPPPVPERRAAIYEKFASEIGLPGAQKQSLSEARPGS